MIDICVNAFLIHYTSKIAQGIDGGRRAGSPTEGGKAEDIREEHNCHVLTIMT